MKRTKFIYQIRKNSIFVKSTIWSHLTDPKTLHNLERILLIWNKTESSSDFNRRQLQTLSPFTDIILANIPGRYFWPIRPADTSGRYFRPILPADTSGRSFRPILPADTSGRYFRPILPADTSGRYFGPILLAYPSGRYFRSILPADTSGRYLRPIPGNTQPIPDRYLADTRSIPGRN